MRNPALLRLMVRAHVLHAALLTSGDALLDSIAARESASRSYLARLAYLAPSLTEAILEAPNLPR
jgi:hypothetical protein